MGRAVAFAGKGGSGKTTLCAIAIGLLSHKPGLRLLAIDADSALGLPYALGVTVRKTVGELREEMIDDPGIRKRVAQRHIREAIAGLAEAAAGCHLLAMGRPEGAGCFCSVNDLLRYGIETLSKDYDLTLIDCEAGPEQLSRRVLRRADCLVVVSDPSQRGLKVAQVIRQVANRGMEGEPVLALAINRAGWGVEPAVQDMGFPVVAAIPEDSVVAEYDRLGRPLPSLPPTSPAVAAVAQLLEKLGLG